MARTSQSSTPPQLPRRLNRWPTTGLKSLFISHSSIRCGCVSARQIFSGGCGISRSTTTERVSVTVSFIGPSFLERASSALRCFLRADGARGRSRRIQCHGGANERLQSLFIDLVALVEIDGTPGVAFEAGVEEALVLQRGALGEGHLHGILVCLTGADDSGVRPHRNPSPLPLLDHFGVGLLDESSDPSERLAPPITQLLDSRIDEPRGRISAFAFVRAALALLHGYCRFRHGCCRSPVAWVPLIGPFF